MKNPFNIIHRNQVRDVFAAWAKRLLVFGITLLGLSPAHAQSVQSPRGREVFGSVGMAAAPAVAAPKIVHLIWDYPVGLQTPDLIFKLYHSTNFALPLRQWSLLTNIPGTLRTVGITADKPAEFFALTASNYLGESSYSSR